jgi:hypothetical protein
MAVKKNVQGPCQNDSSKTTVGQKRTLLLL